MKTILQSHAAAYPSMQPCDAVKLIYQSVFGGGHMIPSESIAAERLRAEYATVSHDRAELHIESLGEISRVYLDSPLDDAALTLIAQLFCASAKLYQSGYDTADAPTKKKFDDRLDILRTLCSQGVFGFALAALDEYLTEYRAQGCPAVSHSQIYRDSYAPAYRVIDSRYVRLINSLRQIGALLETKDAPVVAAIDGRCASGKTTAAELIAQIFPAEIIHMDDFFLPPELRTAERLSEVGGNLHRERFLTEVIPNLRTPDGFAYRVFQCSTFTYAPEPRRIKPSKLIICEGSYSLHPAFGEYYDLALFSDVEKDEQLRRIRERDGEYILTRFINEWIPMEERYFDTFDIRRRCKVLM